MPFMEEKKQFCTRCGRYLEQGVSFCPDCGLRVPGRSQEQIEEEKAQVRSAMNTRLKWAGIMMLVYSIPFLIIGIYIFVCLDGFVNELFTNPAYADYVDFYGLTQDEMTAFLKYVALIYIASSACGIVSSILCFKRRLYWVAMVLCVMSFLMGTMGFFGLFIGLGAFWMLMSSKLCFEEYSDRFDDEFSKIY